MTTTTNDGKPILTVLDADGDSLECFEVFDLGKPALVARVVMRNWEAGVNLTLATATELRDFLNAFLWRHDID
jgi:hypothetical protein